MATVVKALSTLLKRNFLFSHFFSVSLKKTISKFLLGNLTRCHLLRKSAYILLRKMLKNLHLQNRNHFNSKHLRFFLLAKHQIFLPLHSKRHLRSTCFFSPGESTILLKAHTATTIASRGQMSLRIKRCCSITYFSNLAAWWTHSSWAAAVMSFPSTWYWKSKS